MPHLSFTPEVRATLEHQVGCKITHDAHDMGTVDDFVNADVSGACVYIHVPCADLHRYLQHYRACKARRPADTSAVVVVPAWKGRHTRFLRGMQVIRQLPKGAPVCVGPNAKLSHRVQVYFDPPSNVPMQPFSPQTALVMQFDANVAGHAARLCIDTGATDCFINARCVTHL